MSKGKLITFSGIDSAGKSTYIDLYKEELKHRNCKNKVVWSRGGYTSGCELIKKIARKLMRKRLPEPGISEKRTEMFKNQKISSIWYVMAILDMIRLYAIVFRVYKAFGYTVIADRYLFDTQIDFSYMYGDDYLQNSRLWKILKKIYCKPEHSVLLIVSPETSMKRSIEKNESFSESLDRRVDRIKKYTLLANEGLWDIIISTEEDSMENCWEQILQKL